MKSNYASLQQDDIPLRLFVIVPLLFYSGFSIQREKTHASSVMFHALVVFLITMTLFFHFRFLYRATKHVMESKTYQKDFGFFLMALAMFIMLLCLYDIFQTKRK